MYPKFRNKDWYENFWNSQPNAYGKATPSMVDIVSKLYNKLCADGMTSPRVIDIASGNGRYSLTFAQMGFKVVSVDISEAACGILRSRIGENQEMVDVICKDYLDPSDLDKERFDLVFSSGYIDELDKERQAYALSKIKEAVSSSGYILLKYCLEIKNRGMQVEDGFVKKQFKTDEWRILHSEEEKEMRPYPNGIAEEDALRTGVLLAQKI